MKLYVFEDCDKVSDHYHENGGLVVIAKDRASAKDIANKTNGVTVNDQEVAEAIEYELNGKVENKVYTFPDAGCC